MPVIEMEYALSSTDFTRFKQVEKQFSDDCMSAALEIENLKLAVCPYVVNTHKDVDLAEQQFREQSVEYIRKYKIASQEYEEFKHKYRKIFEKGEELADDDCTVRLSWILRGLNHDDMYRRHLIRHKNIYDKLDELYKEMSKYGKYSPYCFPETVKQVRMQAMAESDRLFDEQRDKWYMENRNKLKAAESKFALAVGYPLLVDHLHIEIDGNVSTISGWSREVRKWLLPKPFRQTFINKEIVISR